MRFFWLNDALTIEAEGSEERNALNTILMGILTPNGSEKHEPALASGERDKSKPD